MASSDAAGSSLWLVVGTRRDHALQKSDVRSDTGLMKVKPLGTPGGLLILAAAGTAIAGCGGGGSATAANATPTKAQAVAFAHDVNLRAADLPAMGATKPEGPKEPSPGDRALYRCFGGSDPSRLVAAVGSAQFQASVEGQLEMLKSTVEVQPSATVATANLAAIRGPKGLQCLKRFLPRTFTGKSGAARYGSVDVAPLTVSFPGIAESYGVAVTTTVSGGRLGARRLPVSVDEVEFVSGPAEIGLIAVGIPQAVPPAALERLLGTLYSRAKAHQL
jgi:hypothetical protein